MVVFKKPSIWNTFFWNCTGQVDSSCYQLITSNSRISADFLLQSRFAFICFHLCTDSFNADVAWIHRPFAVCITKICSTCLCPRVLKAFPRTFQVKFSELFTPFTFVLMNGFTSQIWRNRRTGYLADKAWVWVILKSTLQYFFWFFPWKNARWSCSNVSSNLMQRLLISQERNHVLSQLYFI